MISHLTFHSNHWPISYRFRDKRRFQTKIAKFSQHVYFAPLLNGFPLELGTGALGQKLEWWLYGPRKKFDDISSAVCIQFTNVTDGHRATAKTAVTHGIASRGKKKTDKDVVISKIRLPFYHATMLWSFDDLRHYRNSIRPRPIVVIINLVPRQ